jgi:hypothetical protein
MEMIELEMKQRGMYLSRQLSFEDVSFQIVKGVLDPGFVRGYNESAVIFARLHKCFHLVGKTILEEHIRETMFSHFFLAHRRFFKVLGTAAKCSYVVDFSENALSKEKCVVIGFQSGENGFNDKELSDFVSYTQGVLKVLVNKYFPVAYRPSATELIELLNSSSLLYALGTDPELYQRG